MKSAEQIAIDIKITNRGNIIDIAEMVEAINRAREGMIEAPSWSREIWAVQRGTWPPEPHQTERSARWYVEHPVPDDGYRRTLVKRTEYNTEWEVVS